MPDEQWRPTAFKRFVKAFSTSSDAVLIVTDAGEAYLKGMGNRTGPHALACDLVGTALARWFGLQTFDYALLEVREDDEIPLWDGRRVEPGPAFVTRAEKGTPWSSASEDLDAVENLGDLGLIVVLDTWLRNCDRHPPDLNARKPNYDNVFLSQRLASQGRFRVVAMDFGHAFTCGSELTPLLGRIDNVRDHGRYGMFPEFRPHVTRSALAAGVARLAELDAGAVLRIVDGIPAAWSVSQSVRDAMIAFVLDRATHLADDVDVTVTRLMAA